MEEAEVEFDGAAVEGAAELDGAAGPGAAKIGAEADKVVLATVGREELAATRSWGIRGKQWVKGGRRKGYRDKWTRSFVKG